MRTACAVAATVIAAAAFAPATFAQAPQRSQAQRPPAPSAQAAATPSNVVVPADYVIGPEDQLTVVFWREKDLSADVVVRPDGKITLPLLDEVQAAGLTPVQLREKITELAKRYVEDPNANVIVHQINSLKVFITGQVNKPGPYPLTAPTTVLQLIAMAGGITDFAKAQDIVVMRTENGKAVSLPFKYKDMTKRKNLNQNILLKAGDTVIVP